MCRWRRGFCEHSAGSKDRWAPCRLGQPGDGGGPDVTTTARTAAAAQACDASPAMTASSDCVMVCTLLVAFLRPWLVSERRPDKVPDARLLLVRPVHKPPAPTGGKFASMRSNSGRLASALMQKLDHLAGAGGAKLGSSTGPLKTSASLGKEQPLRHGATGLLDGVAANASAAGSPGLPGSQPPLGTHASPAATAGTQPTERAPVKSMMGTEASKLAARLAKLTGEAGVQLATGRAPVTARSSPSPAAAVRPASANRTGMRSSNTTSPSRDMHR